MPEVEVDLVNDLLTPLPLGIYPIEISGANFKKDKNGSDMIIWQMTVIDELNMGYDLYYSTNLSNGVKLPNGEPNLVARKKANYYLQQFLQTIGAPYSEKGFTTESALHCKARVKVSQETIEGGRVVNRVQEVLPFAA